jgi:hypothetical protein
MPITAALLPEFDREMDGLRRTLARAPEGKLDWGPHPKSMTLRGLVTHLSNLAVWGHLVVAEDHFDLAPADGKSTRVPPVQSAAAALETFDGNVAKSRKAIAGASDAHWQSPWSLRRGGEVVFAMPRIAAMRGMVMNHIIHHRGQLTVYLRLLDIPLPSLYGPSADERPPGDGGR